MKTRTMWIERMLLGLAAAGASLAAQRWGRLEDRAVVEAFYVPLFSSLETLIAQGRFGAGTRLAWLAAALSGTLFLASGLASIALEAVGWASVVAWLAAAGLSGWVVRSLASPPRLR